MERGKWCWVIILKLGLIYQYYHWNLTRGCKRRKDFPQSTDRNQDLWNSIYGFLGLTSTGVHWTTNSGMFQDVSGIGEWWRWRLRWGRCRSPMLLSFCNNCSYCSASLQAPLFLQTKDNIEQNARKPTRPSRADFAKISISTAHISLSLVEILRECLE